MKNLTTTLACLMLFTGSAYADNNDYGNNNTQRDPKYMTNTTADCVHGGTGTSENIDCSRNHASRHTTDTNAFNTDTANLDGAHVVRKDRASVEGDGMTAVSNN